MTQNILDHFIATEAVLEGHFLLSSGLHSNRYLQCAQVLKHPERAEAICRHIASIYDAERPDVVIGPAMGGITFAYELGRAFKCPALFAERVDGKFALRRGFSFAKGEKVLVAEDVVTTGGSVKEVMALVEAAGARTVAVASCVHRTEKNPFSVPFFAAMQMLVEAWPESACPLCKEGRPVVKPGSRPKPQAT